MITTHTHPHTGWHPLVLAARAAMAPANLAMLLAWALR